MTERDLIIIGMRRTGTTILFDAFVRDSRFVTLYEPLRIGDDAVYGGGSGSHDVDLHADVRAIAATFLAEHPHLTMEDLNHGGPRRPHVEIEASAPEFIISYLRQVLAAPGRSVTKFVRMNDKIDLLHAVAPEHVLCWVLRDPRAVVRSYLHGRDNRHVRRYPDADTYFGRRTRYDPWSVHRLSEAILATQSKPLSEPTDLERVLIVWGHTVASMRAGARAFGDQAVCVRHEDLVASPTTVVGGLLERMGLCPDPGVQAWLSETVRPPSPTLYASDERWNQAFERVGLRELLDEFGYAGDASSAHDKPSEIL